MQHTQYGHVSSGLRDRVRDLRWPSLLDAAQGGAQGLEDAAALGALLHRGTLPEEVTARMKLFESLRKPRCSEMQLRSYAMAMHIPIAQEERRELIHCSRVLFWCQSFLPSRRYGSLQQSSSIQCPGSCKGCINSKLGWFEARWMSQGVYCHPLALGLSVHTWQ